MVKRLVLALLLFTASIPSLLQAQSIPNTGILYRMDTRPPEVIFRTGFSAWGNNDDLAEHTSGRSCSYTEGRDGNRRSAFVATTANPAFARRLARVAAQSTRSGRAYIYTIRSNDNLYELARSLRAYVPQEPGLATIASHQSEWSAYRQIRNQDVIGVAIYRRGHSVDYRSNPNYLRQSPRINRGLFVPGLRSPDPQQQIYFNRVNEMLVTLCMVALPCLRNWPPC